METSNCIVPPIVVMNENESANAAWKKCTSEMINIVCNKGRPVVSGDFNNVLLENRDLKKQYKMAIAALDSIISEKDEDEDCSKHLKIKNRNMKEKRESINGEGKGKRNSMIKDVSITDKEIQRDTPVTIHVDKTNEEGYSSFKNKTNAFNHQDCRSNENFKNLQKKFNEHNCFEQQEESQISKEEELQEMYKNPLTSENNKQITEKYMCASCSKLQSDNINAINDKNVITDIQILVQDCCKLKRELELARENNNTLKKELISKVGENDQLRDQVQSLELSWRTLTEAINLQDEQLSEYGSVVTSLKNSRSLIIEKMKDSNVRNAHNIMIMENIEKQVEQLRTQLDTYSELLSNQSAELIDKASSTEQAFVDNSFDELMKKKDYYISLLQDRLCEAIVDLKNKDSEIKNHTTSVKALINNYEGEKKCLEERLKFTNLSLGKLEEHKIKQQETMKQLMKLIEFLQDKLEVNKK